MAAKRTRPKGEGKARAKEPEVMPPVGRTFPGCCEPYPDAVFRHQMLVELYAHHRGPRCMGYMEPMDIGEWNAEVDERASAGSRTGGDDR